MERTENPLEGAIKKHDEKGFGNPGRLLEGDIDTEALFLEVDTRVWG